MTKQLIAALLLSATALAVQPASAADIPVKAAPPVAVVAPGGFFFSVTGGYFFDDPNKDIFISPNNGGGGVPPPNCCGAGLGDGWGGRGLVGYRWSLFDVAVAYERANFSKGDPQRSYAPLATALHAPDGRYWAFDGEIGLNVMLGSAKARVFAGPRYVEWRMNDSDGQVGPFTFRVNTRAIGPRIGASLLRPLVRRALAGCSRARPRFCEPTLKGTPGGAGAPIPLEGQPDHHQCGASYRS